MSPLPCRDLLLSPELGTASPWTPPARCRLQQSTGSVRVESQHPAFICLQFERQYRCELTSLSILFCWSLEFFLFSRSHVGCRIAFRFDNEFYPLLDTHATVRGSAVSCCQTFRLLGIFANLLSFSWNLQKGLTEKSMKAYLHIVNLIIRRAVICLNLGRSQSKLFKEIADIFEASSGVIKTELMYLGPIVV